MKKEQEKNRLELLSRILALGNARMDELGDTGFLSFLGGERRALAYATGLLALGGEGNEKRAARLIEAIPQAQWQAKNTFRAFIGMVLYLTGGDRLSFPHRHLLEDCFERDLPFHLLPCYDFVGVNDNTPAMMMAFLFLYGERFHSRTATQTALHRLAQLEDMLMDHAYPAEYNSPTYLGITLHALAALSGLIRDGEIRSRARECEGRLWHMTMLSYDRDAGTIMGPYSRAYAHGSRGKTAQMRLLYACVLGREMPIRPFDNDLCTDREGELLAEGALFCTAEYHCSSALLRHVRERAYPVTVTGTAATSGSADDYLLPDFGGEETLDRLDLSPLAQSEDLTEYAPGITRIITSFHEGYAIGTASRDWHNGTQADGFFALLKRPLVQSQADLCTVFARLSVNEENLHDPNIPDAGRKIALQGGHTAMVLYAPKTAVQEVSSLILRVFFSNPALVTELRCGLRPLHDGDSLPILRDPVCLSLGNVYACILPLMEGGEVRVEQRPDGLALAFTGIAGTPRHMTRKELKLFRFGFVFSALSREECGSFDNFCHIMTEYALQDQLIANHHTRFAYERRVSFRGGGDTLECAYSPVTEGIRILRANGKSLL